MKKFVNEKLDDDINKYLTQYIDEINNSAYKFECMQHKSRYLQTILLILDCVDEYDIKDILVLGDQTIMDWCIKKLGYLDHCNITFTDFDLRYTFPYKSKSYDFIINCEVIEHIKDVSGSTRDVMNYSGLNNVLSECSRVLRQDKIMLLTTPNASSMGAICRILSYTSPLSYPEHVREYCVSEICMHMKNNKFDIVKMYTSDIYVEFHEFVNSNKNHFITKYFPNIASDDNEFSKHLPEYVNIFTGRFIDSKNQLIETGLLNNQLATGDQIIAIVKCTEGKCDYLIDKFN